MKELTLAKKKAVGMKSGMAEEGTRRLKKRRFRYEEEIRVLRVRVREHREWIFRE